MPILGEGRKGKNTHSFDEKKDFGRFSMILNSQTINHTHITNEKKNKNEKNFSVIHTLKCTSR